MATEKTTYTWSDFDLQSALAGTLVGLPDNDNDSENIGKKTGRLIRNTSDVKANYSVTINNNLCFIDDFGDIVKCANEGYIGLKLKMCKADLASTSGTKVTTRAPSGYKDTVSLASLEIRDTFAMQVLQSLLSHCEGNPIYYDDANILGVCASAYRWAQGMMQVAADTRELIKEDEGDIPEDEEDNAPRYDIDVSNGTNTEKLLSNLISAVDDLTTQNKKLREDGLLIAGSTEDATPVKVEAETVIKEIPEITVSNADSET